MDSDLRIRLASDLQVIMNVDASNSPRTPHRKKIGSATGDPWQRVTPIRAPSENGIRIPLSGPHVRNLMDVSRILLLAFFVVARVSFRSSSLGFRIRRMSEGFCFFLVENANRLQRFCSCGGPCLCLFSRNRGIPEGMSSIFKIRIASQ